MTGRLRRLSPVAVLAAAGLLAAGCAAADKSGAGTTAAGGGPTPSATSASPVATPSPTPTDAAGASATPAASASASASVAPVGPGRCSSAQLAITVGGGSGGGAGSLFPAVNFSNSGSTTCTLNGFPGVSYVTGADGHQVGNPAGRQGAASQVTLAPGAVAHAGLRVVNYHNYDAAQCQPTTVAGYRIYPPDEVAAVFVPAAGTACAGTGVDLLTVQAVQAGPPAD